MVKSLNGLRDDVTLAAGANVTLTPDGNTLTITSPGGGSGGPWETLNGNAYYNGGNVGIGTANPGVVKYGSGNVGIGTMAPAARLDIIKITPCASSTMATAN